MTRQKNRSRPRSTGPARPANRARQIAQIQRATASLERSASGARWGRYATGAGRAMIATTTALELLGVGVALAGEVGELTQQVRSEPKTEAKTPGV